MVGAYSINQVDAIGWLLYGSTPYKYVAPFIKISKETASFPLSGGKWVLWNIWNAILHYNVTNNLDRSV